MQTTEHFEWSQSRTRALSVRAGDTIHVTHGCIWLTVDGHERDVWLRAGVAWSLPLDARVWISAEPHASFLVRKRVESQEPIGRRAGGWLAKSLWLTAHKARLPSI